jgi:uroporphyrinogen-III decarboxylase
MSAREAVCSAIAHQAASRVPYCIGFTAEGRAALQRWLGAGQDVDAYADNDVICVSPPWWGWHELSSDWQGAATPSSPAHVRGTGSYEVFFEQLKRLRDQTDKYLLCTIYGSHFEKANFARGIENFLADLATDPPFARRLLRRIIDKNLVMLDNVLRCAEVDGVLLGSDWGTQADLIMSPDTWEEMIRPGEQQEYDLVHAHGRHVWIHSCGNVVKIIPALIEMGVDVLNPVQPETMDLGRLKRQFGARLTFWGGVSTQKTLPYGTADQVKSESRLVRNLLGAGGGYVFAPSQEIQGDVPPANMVALIEVAKETR